MSAQHCVADREGHECGPNGFGPIHALGSFLVTPSSDAAATLLESGGQIPVPDGVTWFAVQSIAVPGSDVCGQDLAALTLTRYVAKVCPLVPRVDANVVDGETYTAIGFGRTNPAGSTAGTRFKVSGLRVLCAEDCADPTVSPNREWIGGTLAQAGPCEGDSGGPAVDSRGRVIGFASRGPADVCNQTVYESVYGHRKWIQRVAREAAAAGKYAPANWVKGGATSNPESGYCRSSAKPDKVEQSARSARQAMTL
jgi:hypothetical protein